MAYPDFEFPDNEPSFMHHSSVERYLVDYAKHFKLYDHIRFKTKVVSVTPLINVYNEKLGERFVKWKVQTCKIDQKIVSETFDGVVVCNGYDDFIFTCCTLVIHVENNFMVILLSNEIN